MIEGFLTAQPPKNENLAKHILCFKVQDAWGKKLRKVYFRVHKNVDTSRNSS